jgi:hypothetical protein
VSGGQVDYFPEANRELADALEWYLERSLQAAEAFVAEIDRAVAVIAAAPTVWPRFEAGTPAGTSFGDSPTTSSTEKRRPASKSSP